MFVMCLPYNPWTACGYGKWRGIELFIVITLHYYNLNAILQTCNLALEFNIKNALLKFEFSAFNNTTAIIHTKIRSMAGQLNVTPQSFNRVSRYLIPY